MSKKLYLFIILIKINILYSYIVLPIEVLPVNNYISKETTALTKIMSYGFKTPFLAKINIGAKLQIIPLILKPSSNQFIISSSKPLVNATINYTSKIFYNLTKNYSVLYTESLTGKCTNFKKTITNNPIAEQICLANETMNFYLDINYTTNKSYSTVNFNLAKNPIDNISGLIGLNLLDENKKNTTSFLSILKSKDIINNYYWYLDFGKSDYSIGKLIIGALPHEINGTNCSANDIVIANSNPNVSSNIWEMKFDKIYYKNISNNNSIYLYNETVELAFDSNYIIGPESLNISISSNLNRLIVAKVCHKRIFTGFDDEFQGVTSKYTFYTCTKPNVTVAQLTELIPSIFLYSSEMNTTFEITPQRIIWEYGNYIYINITFSQVAQNSNKWKLGKPFIFENKLAFNSDGGKIIYYNKLKNVANNTINNTIEDNTEEEKNSNQKVYKLLIIVPLIAYLCAGPIVYAFKQIMKKSESNDNYKNIENKKDNDCDDKIGILSSEKDNNNGNKKDNNNEEKNIIN